MSKFHSIQRAGRYAQTGLNLLEVLVATLILSTGLLGLASLQIAGMKTTHNSYQMQQATWLVYNLFERMRANKAEVLRVDAQSKPNSAYLLVNSAGQPIATSQYCATALAKNCDAVTTCSAAEVATYDLHRVACGSGSDNGMRNVLLNSQLLVNCLSENCATGVRVTMQWDERNASKVSGEEVESFTLTIDNVL